MLFTRLQTSIVSPSVWKVLVKVYMAYVATCVGVMILMPKVIYSPILIAIFSGAILLDYVRTGVEHFPTGQIHADRQPIAYWFGIVGMIFVIVELLFIGLSPVI